MTKTINRRDHLRHCLAATLTVPAWLATNRVPSTHAAEPSPDPDQASAVEASHTTTKLPYVDTIGLQLYTLRNQLANDVKGTLQAVAEAGYEQVELMSIDDQGYRRAQIARDQGLQVRCAFMDFKGITNPDAADAISVEQTIDTAQKIGLEHIVFGYIGKSERNTLDKLRGIADRTNQAAQKIADAGMRLSYHNHSFEFEVLESKMSAMELFASRFDDKLVGFELDVFWTALGGHDPIEWMERLGSRLTLVHLKDILAGTPTIYDEKEVANDAFQELGDGRLDMPAILRKAAELNVKYCHVEQDQSPNPIDSINQSRQFMS